MDSGVLGMLGFVFLFVALDVVSLRFGHDSRRWEREMPFGADAVITLPGARRWLHRRCGAACHGWGIAPQREPMISERPWYQPFRPYLPRPVSCHGFDLAAAGK